MNAERDELLARVSELERRVEVLFRHTGASDWEAEALRAPPVSEEVRSLLAAGQHKQAAERYIEETGADLGQAAAALGEAAKQLRGEA